MTTAVAFELETAEVKELTPEILAWFRSLPASPTERERDEKRIKYLRDKYEANLFTPCFWAVATVNGTTYRMNGQHSSEMLSNLDPLPSGIYIHMDRYKVENIYSLAVLFRQIDDRRSSRSSADVAGAYQGLQEPIRGVSRAVGKLAIEGVAFYNRYVIGLPVPSGDGLYEMFNTLAYHDFVLFAGELIGSKTPELKLVPVIAAIYGTEIAGGQHARDFWTAVATNEFEENTPQAKLDDWLRTIIEDRKLRRDLKPTELYQGCVYAWNAHRQGKLITAIRHDVKKGLLPIHE